MVTKGIPKTSAATNWLLHKPNASKPELCPLLHTMDSFHENCPKMPERQSINIVVLYIVFYTNLVYINLVEDGSCKQLFLLHSTEKEVGHV